MRPLFPSAWKQILFFKLDILSEHLRTETFPRHIFHGFSPSSPTFFICKTQVRMTNSTVVPTCADCQTNQSSVEIRKRQLCQSCFTKYISSKILKRMDTYRFKNQTDGGSNARKHLLLPASGGTSFLVLLEVLDRQIQKQLAQQGRTAYDLTICHIDNDIVLNADKYGIGGAQNVSWWTAVQQTFPQHNYLPIISLTEACQHDGTLEADLQSLGFSKCQNENGEHFITRCLSSPRTPTARTDLYRIILKRLIVGVAKESNCQGILWGHSDTTLASLALASVAKGRGGAVPNELSDGPSLFGLNFNYPLRDLFQTELELYLERLPEDVKSCLKPASDRQQEAPASLRMTSIDALLSAYITGQGEKYPSIMANVVRTASKLQTPRVEEVKGCRLCGMPITVESSEEILCYGCKRMKQDIKTEGG